MAGFSHSRSAIQQIADFNGPEQNYRSFWCPAGGSLRNRIWDPNAVRKVVIHSLSPFTWHPATGLTWNSVGLLLAARLQKVLLTILSNPENWAVETGASNA